jgi:hypothetical protein
MRLHELPLVCARLTCASDLETWAAIASFVMRASGLQTLVMCQFEGEVEHDEDGGGGGGGVGGGAVRNRRMLEWKSMAGVDGTGAEECARAAAGCLLLRGGAMETIVWRGDVDGWRL